jgi:hypothetical protein
MSMLKHRCAAAAFIAALAAGTLTAQEFAPGTPATLGALRFSVPGGYVAVAEMSDSGAAVYGNAATQTWVFVAPLRRTEDRPAVIRTILRRFGTTVLGADPDTLDWQITPSFLTHVLSVFHQRQETVSGPRTLDVSFRQLRSGGADVLVGAAFTLKAGEPDRRCGEWGNIIAFDAAEWMAASLLGRDPPPRTPFEENGVVQMAWSGAQDAASTQPASPDAARLVALYNAYAAAHYGNRRADAAALMAPAVLESAADLRQLVLHGTPEQIRGLPVLQRMKVLILRHQLTADRLARMGPREVFAVSGESQREGLTAGTPRVAGNLAWMDLFLNGRPSPFHVAFVRSGEDWRIDTLPLQALSGCLLRANLRRNGASRAQEDSVVLQSIQGTSDRPLSPDIWLPLVRGGAAPE